MLNLHHDAHYHSLVVYLDNLECPLQGKIQQVRNFLATKTYQTTMPGALTPCMCLVIIN